MGLSVVNKLVIDEVNFHFARRIAYVASTAERNGQHGYPRRLCIGEVNPT